MDANRFFNRHVKLWDETGQGLLAQGLVHQRGNRYGTEVRLLHSPPKFNTGVKPHRTGIKGSMNLLERIANIDVENVTVETVQMLFPWTPRWFAKMILATAVRRGVLVLKADGSYKMAVVAS